jgi:hypothetical protein
VWVIIFAGEGKVLVKAVGIRIDDILFRATYKGYSKEQSFRGIARRLSKSFIFIWALT